MIKWINESGKRKKMKWYEPLIWDEFIEYFSDSSTSYYDIVFGKRVCDEMFINYRETVLGLTMARNRMRRNDVFLLEKALVSEYKYKAYEHFMKCHPYVDFHKYWDSSFCSFFGSLTTNAEELTCDQLALCIMYPFWGRWGSDFIDNTEPKNGKLANAVLTLSEKHNKED